MPDQKMYMINQDPGTRQDPQLFVVPPDDRPMNAGLGAMGTPGKNMTSEEIEQLMKMLKQQQGAN